jgi:hypothetical protein
MLGSCGARRRSLFPAGGEFDQAEIDRFKRILPGLAMSTSEIREIREQSIQSLKQSLPELDDLPLERLRRITFIKAQAGLLRYESPEEGWDDILDVLDAERRNFLVEPS